jgi:hypothetical protein
MDEIYHTPTYKPSPDCLARRGDGRGAAAKEPQVAASTIDLADLLCGPAGDRSGLRRIGEKWVGICPLPDCTAKLRSFVVWPGSDSWHCFCCTRGGNATDLARLAGAELVAKARGW